MSTQDVSNVLAEVDKLLDTLQRGFVDINKLKSHLKNNKGVTDEATGQTHDWEVDMRDRVTRLASRVRQVEERTATLKDNAGKFDMAEWRKAVLSYNQAQFDNSLHWLITMEKDETLDRLRNMSPHHKAAILDLERQITTEKLTKAKESLRIKDAEMSKVAGELTSTRNNIQALENDKKSLKVRVAEIPKVTGELASARNNIRALENDKESLETRVGDLESSARTLEQRHDSVTAQYTAAKAMVSSLHKRVEELEGNIVKKDDGLAAQTSEVTRLKAANKDLQDELTRKDTEISDLNAKLNSEKIGHENTKRQRLQANSTSRYSQREAHTLQGLIAEGLVEINRLEEELRDALDSLSDYKELSLERSLDAHLQLVNKNKELFEKDTDLTEANAKLEQKVAELERVREDCAQKDMDIAQANASLLHNRAELDEKAAELDRVTEDCARKDAELEQKVTELERATEDCARKDTELEQKVTQLEHATEDCARKDTDIAQANASLLHNRAELDEKVTQLERATEDCARKDTDLAQVNANLVQNRAELDQKVTELERATEDGVQKNTDLLHCRQTLERKEADLVQRNTNLALWLMGPKHSGQDVDLWAPLIDCLQLPVPTTQPAIEQCTWWTVARKQQDASAAAPALPAGLLESVALLYGEAIADQYDEDGCTAFLTIIRCLEVAKVAPIPMIMELLRRLLTSTGQDGIGHMTHFGFSLGTWQVIGLIRLRWPETESLADIEVQCQERFEHSPPDFQLIHGLVAGVDCGRQVRSAFDDDGQDKEVPSVLSVTPHKYCPKQRILLVSSTKCCWALDLRRHTILLVDKEKGNFVKGGNYQLQGAYGEEDIVVPSEKNEDLDFIFDHLA